MHTRQMNLGGLVPSKDSELGIGPGANATAEILYIPYNEVSLRMDLHTEICECCV